MANLKFLKEAFERCGAECTLENGQLDVRFQIEGYPVVFTTSVRKGHLFNHFSSMIDKFNVFQTLNNYEKDMISKFVNTQISSMNKFGASDLAELAIQSKKDRQKIEKRWIKFDCDFRTYYISNCSDDE